jgi:hypothetical protein
MKDRQVRKGRGKNKTLSVGQGFSRLVMLALIEIALSPKRSGKSAMLRRRLACHTLPGPTGLPIGKVCPTNPQSDPG